MEKFSSRISDLNLINSQSKNEFNKNMEKFDSLKDNLAETDEIDDLKSTLIDLASFEQSSTNGIKANFYFIPDLKVIFPLKVGEYLYRAVSFPKEMAIKQSLFSIRSKDETTSSGRLHSPHKPVLYLSTNKETAIKEANTNANNTSYIAKFKVIKPTYLRSIFVSANPFTGEPLDGADKFSLEDNKGFPIWYTTTVNEMIKRTFMIPDLKNNPLGYKLTLAIANTFFPLKEDLQIRPHKGTNYSGWLYNSVFSNNNASKNYNIALQSLAVQNLKLEEIYQYNNNGTIDKYLFPNADGSLY